MTSLPHDWSTYLESFHDEHPGITADLLERSHSGRLTPYQWLIEQLPPQATVIDVACGNAPLAALLGARWIGVDRSASELAAAGATGTAARADAGALPFRSGATDVAVCSMSLQVLQPLDAATAELCRVVRDGGCIAAMMPCRGPLSLRDRWRYLRLARIVRDGFQAPNDSQLNDPSFGVAMGMRATLDEQRRFAYRIATVSDADRFVSSLYLPQTSPERIAAARRLARRWVGSDLGIPIRLIIWTVDKADGASQTGD